MDRVRVIPLTDVDNHSVEDEKMDAYSDYLNLDETDDFNELTQDDDLSGLFELEEDSPF